MKYTIPAAATAVLLMLAAPAFAQAAMGTANGAVAGKTDGAMPSGNAMSSGTGMASGNAMAPGMAMSDKTKASDKMAMTKKKKKAGTAMSGSATAGSAGAMNGMAH